MNLTPPSRSAACTGLACAISLLAAPGALAGQLSEAGELSRTNPHVEWSGSLAGSRVAYETWDADPVAACASPACGRFTIAVAGEPLDVSIGLKVTPTTPLDTVDPDCRLRILGPDGTSKITTGVCGPTRALEVVLNGAVPGEYAIDVVESHASTFDYVAHARVAPVVTPAPACEGIAVSDPAGDNKWLLAAGPDNLDVTSVFFRSDVGKGGVLKTTANIRVKRLDMSTPPGSYGVNWVMHWTDSANRGRFVAALMPARGRVYYRYGTSSGNLASVAGTTTGATFQGLDGVVQIDLPAAYASPGARLRNPYAATSVAIAGADTPSDSAPDDPHVGIVPRAGYSVAACPQPAQVAQPLQAKTPREAPLGILRVLTRSVRAAGVSSTRPLAARVTTTAPLSGLVATLKRRGVRVGTGRRAVLRRTGTVRVRLAAGRRVVRGVYTLSLTARDARGARVATSARIRLR